MNKIKLLFVVTLLLSGAGRVRADLIAGADAWKYTHIASSGSIFTGSGELGAVYMSSGAQGERIFAVLYDTGATISLNYSVALGTGNRVTPALLFQSSATYTRDTTGSDAAFPSSFNTSHNYIGEGGDGIRVERGLYYLPSVNGASGEARRVVIKWRRGRR